MTFNTGNNVPSTDPRDLYDNAENLDKLVNGADPFYADRLGKLRESWAGMENSFTNAQEGRETAFTLSQADKESRFQAFLVSSGYVSKGDYAASVVLAERNEYVAVSAATTGTSPGLYRPNASATVPLTLTGTWATDAANLVLLGDDVLRQELAGDGGAAMIGGAGQVVSSISALRGLLKTSPSKSAFVSGYYAQGDGGGGAYYLDAGDTTTADNGGTVIVAADGGRWKLSQQGMVSVKQFGAKGDGTTDDHAAVQSAHSAGHSVFYPEGTYQCSAKVAAAAPFGLFGAGINRTIIRFTGATQGYAITQGFGVGVIIEGASFRTNATPSANHIGLQVNGQSQFSGTTDGAGRQIIGDRTLNRASVTNVDFRGSTEAAGWYAGLNLRSVMNFAVSDITTSGVVNNTGNYSGVGVLIDGDGIPVDWSIRRMWSFYQDTAVMCPDYTEGGHIYDFEFVNVLYGIRAGYVAGFSALPEGACGALGMFITQGHVNCRLAGVFLQGTNQDTISGLNLYLNPLAGDASAFGVQLVNGNFNQISGVRVNGVNAKNTKANNNGVILSGVGLSTIEGCSANGIGAAVALVNSSTINTLGAILATDSVNAVATDGTSTGNMIANTVKGVSLSGPVYSGSPDNFVERRSFSATTVQSLGGGTSFTFTAPVPAGYFTEVPDVAAAVTSSGATAIDCIYNYELSTATSLSFTVVSTSLPSGSVRFGISAEGR